MELYSQTLGTSGRKVRVYERTPGGVLYRSVWSDGKEDRVSLGHRDRQLAETQAYQLLAGLTKDKPSNTPASLTLGVLISRYEQSAYFQGLSEDVRTQHKVRFARFTTWWGSDFLVSDLDDEQVTAYCQARRLAKHPRLIHHDRAVGDRTLECELGALKAACNWAGRTKGPGGRVVLDQQPFKTITIPKEKNPQRHVRTHGEFLRLLRTSPRIHTHLPWALRIAEASGRRLEAFRVLRWDDVLWEQGKFFWRADADKEGYELYQAIPPKLMMRLRREFGRRAGVSPWVFYSLKNPARPYNSDVFDKWLRACETLAKVDHLPGTLWHAFRRKWATERKGYSLIDVAGGGGWKDTRTVEIYTKVDSEMMERVVLQPTLRLSRR